MHTHAHPCTPTPRGCAQETQGIILPFYRFRVFWDCLIFLFVSYTAITLPIILAYPVCAPSPTPTPSATPSPSDSRVLCSPLRLPASPPPRLLAFSPPRLLASSPLHLPNLGPRCATQDATGTFEIVANLELVMDIVFIIDIGLNFRTAYIEHAELVVDRKRIVRKYLSKWFAIDLIGSIPWEIIFRIIRATSDGDAGSAQVVTLVKILKAPKMLRLGRFLKVLESIEGAANVGRIIMLMVMMAVFVHWISCLWYAVASADPDGFLERKGVAKDPWHEQYFENYYTSLMMVMGDSIFPITSWEKLFASLVVLVGACANATIFANVAAYVAQIGMMSARHKQRIDGASSPRLHLALSAPQSTHNHLALSTSPATSAHSAHPLSHHRCTVIHAPSPSPPPRRPLTSLACLLVGQASCAPCPRCASPAQPPTAYAPTSTTSGSATSTSRGRT